MMELKKLIFDLTSLDGNCGNEDNVIKYILKKLKSKADEIKVDSIGNVVATFKSIKKNPKKIMVFAHMDEVGMIVRKIDNDGFIRVEKLGSCNPNILSGLRVEMITEKGKIPGVVGVKSHHFLQPEDKGKIASLKDIYIDIGAFSKEDVEKCGVKIGTPIVYKSDFLELQNNLISNKAMDDRALVAVLINLGLNINKEKLNNDLYIVFSVQEEFNTRGILPMVKSIKPDFTFGFDITPACDTPDLKSYSDIKVGNGVAITYMNHHSRGTLAGLTPNFRLLKFIEKTAEENKIKFQREVATGILTETAYIVLESENGVVGNISIPTRYTHSNIEVLSLDDILGSYNLIKNIIYKLDSSEDFSKKKLLD